jgi:hypothetical protein
MCNLYLQFRLGYSSINLFFVSCHVTPLIKFGKNSNEYYIHLKFLTKHHKIEINLEEDTGINSQVLLLIDYVQRK